MGFLSSIAKIALTPSTIVAKQILKVIKPSSTVATQSISKSTTQLASTTFGKVLGGAIAVTGGALAVASLPTGSVSAITKAITPTTLKGKVIGGAVSLVTVPAIVSNPSIVPKTIGGLVNFGSNIGEVSKNPTTQGFTDIIKENPIISTATGLIVAGAIGKGVAGTVASVVNTQAIKEQTEAIKGGNMLTPQETGGTDGQNTTITPTNPTTPQTVYMDDKPKTTQKKTYSKARRQPISQRVNLIVNQNNKNYSSHRRTQTYLNEIRQLN
jgi:hypothetical protein